jgi:hypothetical protein
MKEKILNKLKEISTDQIKSFLESQGISSWKLSLASREQMIDGIKKEMEKYTPEQLEEFYNNYLNKLEGK